MTKFDRRKTMLKLLKTLNWKEWLLLGCCAGLIVLQVWLDLKMPDFMQEITTLLKTENIAMKEIWKYAGYMIACALGALGATVIVGFLAARVAASVSFKLRKKVYEKVESFSMEEIKKFSTASLLTRTTNDVTQVQTVITMGFQLLVRAPITAIWAICKIANSNWRWTAATGVAVGIMVCVIMIIVIFAVPRFKRIQTLTDNLNRATRENLEGVRVVRAYNAEDYQEAKFESVNDAVTKNHLTIGRTMAIMGPGMSLISNGLQLAIYWIGAFLINRSANSIENVAIFSEMMVYMTYAMRIVMSFMLLIMFFMMLPRAAVSARRINEVLDTQPNIFDGKGVPETELKGVVEFKNVSFKYPDAQEYVVKNVSFKAEQGQTVAFIGSTGSGKSTLINLIPRFYDATEGEILVDGVNVKEYAQHDLHNKIGYVPQKAVLFAGDIASNIAFGDNGRGVATQEDIENAAKIAQAKNIIERKEDKYASRVAQGGTNLSGGQKQRLAIARAIARKPEIFIFDDSFSALDYKTDKALRKELKKKTADATKFIVAQRIGTIIDADKIVVLEQGDVVGIGTHQELLKSCQVYQEIAYSQLSKEELGDE